MLSEWPSPATFCGWCRDVRITVTLTGDHVTLTAAPGREVPGYLLSHLRRIEAPLVAHLQRQERIDRGDQLGRADISPGGHTRRSPTGAYARWR